MRQPDQDHVPALVQIAGLQAYQSAIDGMLRRLVAARLVERLWDRDPSLWYPAAETQARIRARLGWLDLPTDDSQQIVAWLETLRSRQIMNVLYVGIGDANMISRLWRDLADVPHAPRLTLLDTIDPAAVQVTLAATDWEHTAILLTAESALTPDIDALARIVLAARAQAASPNALPLAVIAPPDSALISLMQSYAMPALLPLPPDLGARFAQLSPLGLVPAALLGWQLDRLRGAALEMWEQCRRQDLALNPSVWLGTTLAVLAQHGRDKLTLRASPALLPLAHWIAGFVSGSLSKHGRGFVMDVEEPRTQNLEPGREQRTKEQRTKEQGKDVRALLAAPDSPPRLPQPKRRPAEVRGRGWHGSAGGEGLSQYPGEGHDRIIVALRLASAHNDELDHECAALAAAGLPVVTLEVADRYVVAGQIVMWQVAVATIGVVLGLNPFDEPDTAARDAYLWRQLEAGGSGWLPPATPLAFEALVEVWRQLSPAITSTRCIAIAAYLPGSTAVHAELESLRTLLARRFGVTAIVIEPLREQAFATQVLHAGRPCAILLLTAKAADTVAVPGRAWTLDDLRRERIAADLLAWTQLQRRFVHLDLGSDAAQGLRRCLDLLAALDQ